MTVYSANIFDLAEKVPKGKKKVAIPAEVPKEAVPKVTKKRAPKKSVEPAVEKVAEASAPPAKKPRTEKQLAADEKRREAAALKKTALHNEKLKALYHPEPVNASKTITPKKKAPVKTLKAESEEPPAWFNQYMHAQKNKENKESEVKKPAAEVKQESKSVAAEKWNEPTVRAAVIKEVSSHQNKMYNMMFRR